MLFLRVVIRSLYPGLEARFLSENIKPSVKDRLKVAANSRGNVIFVIITLKHYSGDRGTDPRLEVLVTPTIEGQGHVQMSKGCVVLQSVISSPFFIQIRDKH